MKHAALVVTLALSGSVARAGGVRDPASGGSSTGMSVEEGERRARENIIPKLNLMCGTQLTVRYDKASLVRINPHGYAEDPTRECEMPLRILFSACTDAKKRKTIAFDHLTSYECRRGEHDSIAVREGSITFVIASAIDRAQRARELSVALHLEYDPFTDGEDGSWASFVAAAVPSVTSTSYCEIDGEKTPLSQSGDPMAPESSRVRCLLGGKVVTDLVPEAGGRTGFQTLLDGKKLVYHTYRRGRLDGESWEREGKVVTSRALYVNGDLRMDEQRRWNTGALSRHRMYGRPRSEIEFDEAGAVTSLECGAGAATDEVLRGYCGYDGEKTTEVFDKSGPKRVTYKDGQLDPAAHR